MCAEQEDVSIKLIDTKDHLLSTYDRALSDYTGSYFKRQGIQVLSESHVRTQPSTASCAFPDPSLLRACSSSLSANPSYPWGLLQVSSVDSEGVMVKCKDGSEPRVTGRTVIWARAPFPGAAKKNM